MKQAKKKPKKKMGFKNLISEHTVVDMEIVQQDVGTPEKLRASLFE